MLITITLSITSISLFSEIKSSVKRGLRPEVLDVSKDLIESCIASTLEFNKSKARDKEERIVKYESCSSDIRFVYRPLLHI